MILSKNRLKKLKKTIDDDDMLNYLKFSHLETIRENKPTWIQVADKGTQAPDTKENHTQTERPKIMVDKATDTYDELNKIEGKFKLLMSSDNFRSKEPSRAEKMAQVTAKILEPTSRPLSEASGDDKEGATRRNVRRGFRIAEMAFDAAVTTASTAVDVADFLWNATAPAEYDVNNINDNDETEEDEAPTTTNERPSGSTDIPTRDRSRSRDASAEASRGYRVDSSDNNVGHGLLRRGASRSRSSSPASSAKTTPKKK